MAFKLPPEKSGWLGPEEHFTDTGDISDDPVQLPAIRSQQNPQHGHREPEKRPNMGENSGSNRNRRKVLDCDAFKAPSTDPYVVGYVVDKDKMTLNGFVSYPDDAIEKECRDGSVVSSDKRRDAFVCQPSAPQGFEKTSPVLDHVTVPVKCEVQQSKGANFNKSHQRAKTTSCFGKRGDSEGSFYYMIVPKKREPRVHQEPIAIIDVDRYKKYENEEPSSRNSPVASPTKPLSKENKRTIDRSMIAHESERKGNRTFQSILKKPIEHLPHTHYPKLSSLSPKRMGIRQSPPTVDLVQKAKVIDDGQVFSSHVRFSNDIAAGRAEVEAASAFVQDAPGHRREPRGRDWAGFVTFQPSPRSTTPLRGSPRAGKSPERSRIKERVNPTYQFSGSGKKVVRRIPSKERPNSPCSFPGRRKKDLLTIDEEVHANYDDSRDQDPKEKRLDLSSDAKHVIVSRVSSPGRSHGTELSRQTSESALSTSSRKRKRREHKYPGADADFYENTIKEPSKSSEEADKRNDWTGLNTYQARRNKFGASQSKFDLVKPDICEIRQTRVQKTFEENPLVYSTSSTEVGGCRNARCVTTVRHGSSDREGRDCYDDVGTRSPRREGPERQAKAGCAKKADGTRDEPVEVVFKRPASIRKEYQTDFALTDSRDVGARTLNRDAMRPENNQNQNYDAGVQTHYANPSFQASDLSQRRASVDVYDEQQADDIPTIDELNARFYTPATVLPNPYGKDRRFHDAPPERPRQQTKDTQTVFRSSSLGPRPIEKTQKFYNIVGPSSKVRQDIDSEAPCQPQLYNGPPKQRWPSNVGRGFDESQPYEHVYSDSFRVLPDIQNLHNCNRPLQGDNLDVNYCEGNFVNHGNKGYYENPKEYIEQDSYYRDSDGYGSPGRFSPEENGNPGGYGSPDEYARPDGNESPDGFENGGTFPPPAFVGKPLGQTNNNQVVEGAWDFMRNLFRKKKFRDAAYNKRAEVSCGDCGNGMRFTLSVGMQDSANCLVCYNRVRDEFTELFNVYKEKGYLPCDCKKTISVTDLVNGYMAQEKVTCTCIGDSFIDLGK